jgi:creatinine deaminase
MSPGTHTNLDDLDTLGMATALAKARKSAREGGVPIGAALVYHGGDTPNAAAVLGCAHNQRIQKSSPTLHAEMAALEDAGRQRAAVYRRSTMVGVFPLPI